MSQKQFLRWVARETESHRFGNLGNRSLVFPPALIIGHERIHIGDEVVVHPGSFISVVAEEAGTLYDSRVSIGDRTRIGFDFVIACCGSIEIGREVLIADRAYIGDTYHEYRDPNLPVISQGLGESRPVRIGDGAFLGINSAILPGVTVGVGAYVGANAVVTSDVPERTLVVGNPARIVRRWDGTAWVDEPR